MPISIKTHIVYPRGTPVEPPRPPTEHWCDWDNERLRALWPLFSISAIASMMKRTRRTITNRAEKLGLPKCHLTRFSTSEQVVEQVAEPEPEPTPSS